MEGRPWGFTIRPTPAWTPGERRRLRRWLAAMAVDNPAAARHLRLERGGLRVRTADARLARSLAVLAGAVIRRRPFAYTLVGEPDIGPPPGGA